MLKTALHDQHVAAGAKMADFAGYTMPVMYESIIAEHEWTRAQVGLFDVSHMGRLEVIGAEAAGLLDALASRTIVDLEVGQTVYAVMCNEGGGILDDVMISRLGAESFYIVCNAGNREKIANHVRRQVRDRAKVSDVTDQTMMVAIQGPRTIELLKRFVPGPLAELPHRHATLTSLFGLKFIAFRGGYTGEDGFEVVFQAKAAATVWQMLGTLTLNGERVVKPAGLGARGTLRLEAALPLYGQELSEQIDPISAGVPFAVDLAHDFLGKAAIEKVMAEGPRRVRVGLTLSGRRASRPGHTITLNDDPIGEVTSGAFCPTVNASIAMGFVRPEHAAPGTRVHVDTGRTHEAAEVVTLPFYRRGR